MFISESILNRKYYNYYKFFLSLRQMTNIGFRDYIQLSLKRWAIATVQVDIKRVGSDHIIDLAKTPHTPPPVKLWVVVVQLDEYQLGISTNHSHNLGHLFRFEKQNLFVSGFNLVCVEYEWPYNLTIFPSLFDFSLYHMLFQSLINVRIYTYWPKRLRYALWLQWTTVSWFWYANSFQSN